MFFLGQYPRADLRHTEKREEHKIQAGAPNAIKASGHANNTSPYCFVNQKKED